MTGNGENRDDEEKRWRLWWTTMGMGSMVDNGNGEDGRNNDNADDDDGNGDDGGGDHGDGHLG